MTYISILSKRIQAKARVADMENIRVWTQAKLVSLKIDHFKLELV